MANIPIRDIPGAVVASPDPSNLIPMDNGSLMQKTTIANAVNTTLPLSSQAEAEAGVDNAKRMSPLRTKQAIDAQTPSIVNTAITALNLGSMSQEDASDYTPTSGLAAVALSNDYNDLDNLPTLGTAAATDASDYATAAQGALAGTAIQPGDAALVPSGGTIGQVLVKNSGTNYDTGWVSSAAATAVSYAPQTLTDAQAGQARANIDAGLLSGFRNKIINGDFGIAQRGTSFPAATGNTYTLDRWQRLATTSTIAITLGSLGNTDFGIAGLSQPNFIDITVVGTAGAGDFAVFQQRIEDVRTLAGKRITLSFWCAGDARNIGVEVAQDFGVGGSALVAQTQVIAQTSEWTQHKLVFDLPTLSGKTIAAGNHIAVSFWFSSGATLNGRAQTGVQSGNFNLARVSFVEGDATAEDDPFSPRHIQQEIALCQRYAWVTEATGFIGLVRPGIGPAGVSKPTPVRMRAVPTLSIIGGSGSIAFSDGDASATYNSFADNNSTVDCIQFIPGPPVSGGFPTAQVPIVGFHSTGNGSILASAEL